MKESWNFKNWKSQKIYTKDNMKLYNFYYLKHCLRLQYELVFSNLDFNILLIIILHKNFTIFFRILSLLICFSALLFLLLVLLASSSKIDSGIAIVFSIIRHSSGLCLKKTDKKFYKSDNAYNIYIIKR